MNINDQLTNLVSTISNSITNDIKDQVRQDIELTIDQHIQASWQMIERHVSDAVSGYDFESAISNIAAQSLDKHLATIEVPVDQIKANLEAQATQTLATVRSTINTTIHNTVLEIMEQAGLGSVIEETLADQLTQINFPPNSIRATAVNWQGHRMSGDHIKGGIITEFSSTGIDDRATGCQLTIMDSLVVIEPPMITTGVEVRGNIIAESLGVGTIELTGRLMGAGVEKLGNTMIAQVRESIAQSGIDTAEIRSGDKTILTAAELGDTVLTSSLRKVGTLNNLETTGETNLSETLYAYRRRVGINTLEPSHTFEVNDGEVQFMVEKVAQNRVFVGTQRNQAMTLGANGKNNLSIDTDGSVTINDLKLGAVTISTTSQTPTWSGHTGELVFNDSPRVGQPSFWCCLGGHRWAIGATITE